MSEHLIAAPARATRTTRARRPERHPDTWNPSRRGFTADLHLPTQGAGPWTTQAACAQPGTDPDRWFSDQPTEIAAAQEICGGCPVRAQCADLGAVDSYDHGIWAGKDHTVRKNATRTNATRTRTTPLRVRTPTQAQPAPAAPAAPAIPAQRTSATTTLSTTTFPPEQEHTR